MVSVTVSISEDIKKKMEQFPEINWSGLVRTIIETKVHNMMWKEEMKKRINEDKEFTNWSIIMGKKTKQGITQRLKKEGFIK